MQTAVRGYFEKVSLPLVLSFMLLTAISIVAAAQVTARPAAALDPSGIELETIHTNALSGAVPPRPDGLASVGPAPHAAAPSGGSPSPSGLAAMLDILYPAFALKVVMPDSELVFLADTTVPGTWDAIATVPGTDYFAGDFVGGDDSRLYVLHFSSNELHTLDTATGADTTVGPSAPVAGQVWTGATGTADGTLYASSTAVATSTLYTVNTGTGAATVVGEITNAPCIIDIAINPEGDMYGLDICLDALVAIDPATGAGTVIGPIGYVADFAQGMDFEDRSGVLYLAAYNVNDARGELRIADTATGDSVLVGPFPNDAETDALAFARPTSAPEQILLNPGFEDNWTFWQTEGFPALSGTSHGGAVSARFDGEEEWAWQPVVIPGDALAVSISYWLTGISSDPDWDNDIICVGLWDLARQTQHAGGCFGLTYFYSYPMVWRTRTYNLDAAELGNVAGQVLLLAVKEYQDWNPGYHRTSTAYVDDIGLYVTRPIYDFGIFLPLAVRP